MTEEGNGNGVVYTTKELLNRIDAKIDRLDEKLDSKADQSVVMDVQRRLSEVERTMVRTEGPIIKGLKHYERVVDNLASQFMGFEATLSARILEELTRARKANEQARDRSLSRSEKVTMMATSIFAAIGTVISLVIAIKLGWHHG